jgi:aspartyl/asparaginyl-tRNA synthetase
MQPSSAINKFLENFHYRMTADLMSRMQERGQNIHDVIPFPRTPKSAEF